MPFLPARILWLAPIALDDSVKNTNKLTLNTAQNLFHRFVPHTGHVEFTLTLSQCVWFLLLFLLCCAPSSEWEWETTDLLGPCLKCLVRPPTLTISSDACSFPFSSDRTGSCERETATERVLLSMFFFCYQLEPSSDWSGLGLGLAFCRAAHLNQLQLILGACVPRADIAAQSKRSERNNKHDLPLLANPHETSLTFIAKELGFT